MNKFDSGNNKRQLLTNTNIGEEIVAVSSPSHMPRSARFQSGSKVSNIEYKQQTKMTEPPCTQQDNLRFVYESKAAAFPPIDRNSVPSKLG